MVTRPSARETAKKAKQEPPKQKPAMRTFIITDEKLLKAVTDAKLFPLKNGNEVDFYIVQEADGEKVWFPDGVRVKNVNKNIYQAIKHLHGSYLEV